MLSDLTDKFADVNNLNKLQISLGNIRRSVDPYAHLALHPNRADIYFKDPKPYYDPTLEETKAKIEHLTDTINNMTQDIKNGSKNQPNLNYRNEMAQFRIQNQWNMSTEARNDLIKNNYYNPILHTKDGFDVNGPVGLDIPKDEPVSNTLRNMGDKIEVDVKEHHYIEPDEKPGKLPSKYIQEKTQTPAPPAAAATPAPPAATTTTPSNAAASNSNGINNTPYMYTPGLPKSYITPALVRGEATSYTATRKPPTYEVNKLLNNEAQPNPRGESQKTSPNAPSLTPPSKKPIEANSAPQQRTENEVSSSAESKLNQVKHEIQVKAEEKKLNEARKENSKNPSPVITNNDYIIEAENVNGKTETKPLENLDDSHYKVAKLKDSNNKEQTKDEEYKFNVKIDNNNIGVEVKGEEKKSSNLRNKDESNKKEKTVKPEAIKAENAEIKKTIENKEQKTNQKAEITPSKPIENEDLKENKAEELNKEVKKLENEIKEEKDLITNEIKKDEKEEKSIKLEKVEEKKAEKEAEEEVTEPTKKSEKKERKIDNSSIKKEQKNDNNDISNESTDVKNEKVNKDNSQKNSLSLESDTENPSDSQGLKTQKINVISKE